MLSGGIPVLPFDLTPIPGVAIEFRDNLNKADRIGLPARGDNYAAPAAIRENGAILLSWPD